jgi:hypothetical protein
MEKREHSATRCIALVASLKTIYEKLQKTHNGKKEYNRCHQDNYNLQGV